MTKRDDKRTGKPGVVATRGPNVMVVTSEKYEDAGVIEEPFLEAPESPPTAAIGPIEPTAPPKLETAADRASEPDGYVEPVGTKHNNPCLASAGDDEPIFVLRAHDVLAVPTVNYWIDLAASVGVPADKLARAREDMKRMEAWAAVHGAKRPD